MKSQFDQLGDIYEASMRAMPFRCLIEAPSILNAVGNLNNSKVLDMGCGSGIYTRLLKHAGASHVLGVDISEGMLSSAKAREKQEKIGVNYLHCDLDNVSLHAAEIINGEFDLVTAIYVLPYAKNTEQLSSFCQLAHLALAESGGRFIAAVLNPDFNSAPSWYKKYGMDFTSKPAPKDGDKIHMTAWIEGKTLDVDAFYWSKRLYENTLYGAGFSSIRWISPTLFDDAHTQARSNHWDDYLNCPHALIVEATKHPRCS